MFEHISLDVPDGGGSGAWIPSPRSTYLTIAPTGLNYNTGWSMPAFSFSNQLTNFIAQGYDVIQFTPYSRVSHTSELRPSNAT